MEALSARCELNVDGLLPMFVLISISSEVFGRMMSMRLMHRRLGIGTSASREASDALRLVRDSFGGKLVLIDWTRGEVLAAKSILGASGLAVHERTIVASSWIEPEVYILKSGERIGTMTHRWLNYVHSADLTSPHSMLVASAGSDLIAELSFDGEVLWEWFGPEHGYGIRPDGLKAFFDRDADYRAMGTSTAEQAMHVSSAILLTNNTVLATLFHQGVLISIERESGTPLIVLDGLSRPHGVHRRNGGFLLSDTLGHRIILLNHDLQVCREIPFGSQWLQDTIVTSKGTYLTLENVHINQLPEPDLRNRITEIDEQGRQLRAVGIGVDFRLFTAREVDDAHADALVRAWGKLGSFSTWRWE
jgi:hypothetical protein